MFTIKDLISEIDFEKVSAQIERYYKTEKTDQFKLLYQHLKSLDPEENIDNMVIFIQVFKTIGDEDEPIYFPEYNEQYSGQYDEKLYFDVCGKDNNYDGFYSIASSEYKPFLGYFIKDETLKMFTKESILAHCLWEITFYGFDASHAV